MCRWLADFGQPLPLEDLLYKPEHSLIGQSLHAKFGPHTANGDGFGIGCMATAMFPRSTEHRSCGLICLGEDHLRSFQPSAP